MAVGDAITVTGYVTQEKFLIGRPLEVLETYLGFHEGRLARGATFVKLDRLPFPSEFELAAYSMTAAHRHTPPTGLDQEKLKGIAREQWTLAGGDRLIKVLATVRHDPALGNEEQYPPGAGVPQWKIVGNGLPGTVVAELTMPGQVYRPQR